VPPTAVPPTAVPPTAVPPTAIPPTAVPPTSASEHTECRDGKDNDNDGKTDSADPDCKGDHDNHEDK
jgi:hypothetical protein